MGIRGSRARLRDESGATAIEYAMIVAGIGLFLLAASALVGRGVETTLSHVGEGMQPAVSAQPGTGAPTAPLPPSVRDPGPLTPVPIPLPSPVTGSGGVKTGSGTGTPGGSGGGSDGSDGSGGSGTQGGSGG